MHIILYLSILPIKFITKHYQGPEPSHSELKSRPIRNNLLAPLSNPHRTYTLAERKKMKDDITVWRVMVPDFLQDDPEIRHIQAQLNLVWQMLDLDDVYGDYDELSLSYG